ncbi:hypothetical protein [Streptomyces sp. NPDC051993]|uniref:hypothetical protein n=1 Tax=Streptomyces sp. NPDC051993 TaxID=3155286 RepID=UPI0034258950
MKITIEGASDDFARELVALAAQQHADLTVTTVETGWTVDRAERYLRSLPASARRFAEMVFVDGEGYIDADHLRSALVKLNGPTVALSRAMPRGVRKGWWPEGTPAPITPVSDPDNPSWHQNIAYRMDAANVPIFSEALCRIRGIQSTTQRGGPLPADDDQDEQDRQPFNWAEGDVPSGLDPVEPPPGWGADDDVPRVLPHDAQPDGRSDV